MRKLGLLAVFGAMLFVSIVRGSVDAVAVMTSGSTASGGITLDDYGWGSEVDIDASRDTGATTEGWTYAHVSGESGKYKMGYAGLHDGYYAWGSIVDATRPDWVHGIEGWVIGSVWVDNHYVHAPTSYLGINHAEFQYDTSETSPDVTVDEVSIVKESDEEVWAEAVREWSETTYFDLGYFSVTYKIHPFSFAATDRPEFEIFSETSETWATGYMKAYDNIYGSPGTQVGDTIYLD